MADYQWIGKRIPRAEGPLVTTGVARYAADINLPGMLYGRLLRSPHAHARILRVDTGRAERLPGVKAVVSGQEIVRRKFGPFPDEYALAIDKVRYIGEAVAGVAAIDKDTAEEALDLIEVEYEPLPPLFDPLQAMQPDAIPIHEKGNVSSTITLEYGDVEEGFGRADYVRQDRFTTQPISHGAMEPHAAVAQYDPSGKLTIWVSNQSPHIKRRVLAATLGLPESDVHVKSVFVGGAFGAKAEMVSTDFCAAFLAMKSGRPVKAVMSREEVFTATRQRHPMIIDLKTGVKRDGTLLARQCRLVADTGAYNSTGPMTIYLSGTFFVAKYRTPNIKYEGFCVYTNSPTRGAVRGHGQLQECFATDSQLDRIADDLGIDPLEVRLKNAVQSGDALPHGLKIGSCGLRQCLEQAAERSGWRQKRRPGLGRSQGQDGSARRRGIGMATGCYLTGLFLGPHTASAAYVRFNEDGSVMVTSGGIDIGQGFNNVLRVIAAEELGLPVGAIKVVSGDSESGPADIGSYTSSATYVTGNAVRLAAAEAKRQMLEFAAQQLEARVEDLEIVPDTAGGGRGSSIGVKGSPGKRLPVSKLIMASFLAGRPILGKGYFAPKVDIPRYGAAISGQLTPTFSYSVQVAEVEVDRDTGQVEVVRLTEALDCGQPINAMEVEGQIEGSISMSMGYGLGEELLFEDGQILNPSFLEYKFPNAQAQPAVETIHIPSHDPDGPFGGKEAGETSVVLTAAAVANAVSHALGVRLNDLPLTPQRILKALEDRDKTKEKNKVKKGKKGGKVR